MSETLKTGFSAVFFVTSWAANGGNIQQQKVMLTSTA